MNGGDVIDKLWWPHAGVIKTVCDSVTYDDAILREKDRIKSYLRSLKEFAEVYYGIKAKPLLGIDERFIYRLRGTLKGIPTVKVCEVPYNKVRNIILPIGHAAL